MEAIYYYLIDGNKMGPYSLFEIQNRDLKPETLVWKQGMKGWNPVKRFPEVLNNLDNLTPPPVPTDKKTNISSQKINVSTQNVLIRAAVAAGFALIVKFISYDMIVTNFGGHQNMGSGDYSEANAVSYSATVLAFLLVILIFFLFSKKS